MLTFYCFQDLCLPFNFSDRTFRSCPFKWDYIADASFYNESVYLPLYSNGNKKKILGNIGRLGNASAVEGAHIMNSFSLQQSTVIIIPLNASQYHVVFLTIASFWYGYIYVPKILDTSPYHKLISKGWILDVFQRQSKDNAYKSHLLKF